MRYGRNFSKLYNAAMYIPEEIFLRPKRSRLLSGLSGKILEVGVGTGTNFRYYGYDVEIIGIEPSPYMISKAEERKKKLPFPNRFMLHNIGCGYSEMKSLIRPDSLDAVVCTLVLCTIPDPGTAMAHFMKWLKPGGRLLILEHVQSHHPVGVKLQNLLNSTWEKLGEGCQLNRPTDRLLAESGFNPIREKYFWLGVPFYEAEFEKPEK